MDIQHKKAILARFSKDMFPLTKSLAWFCRFMLKNKDTTKESGHIKAYSKKKCTSIIAIAERNVFLYL